MLVSRRTALYATVFAFASWHATAQLHLIPQPRTISAKGDIPIRGATVVCEACDADDQFAASNLRETLNERHVPNGNGLRIVLQRLTQHPDTRFTEAMKPEGYTIAYAPGTLTLTGATASGVFYAAQTAKQLFSESTNGIVVLHAADIRDWPAMKYRGLHDDLSRGPVDTFEFQKKLIRTLAAYKDNVYSPYFESTQAYPSMPLSAIPGASLTPAEATELVAYARQYHVTVIPEQEAFGHLRHMLTWEQYANAAETPHGAVLAPGQPQSMQMIDGMFKDLARMYPGPFLHIGGDETFELGYGRTRPDVDQRGLAPVYLDFMQRIVADLKPLNRKILFWGDIVGNQRTQPLLKALPQSFKSSVIAVAWGYSPKPSFDNYLRPFADSGIPFWVAPSINNYRQMWPNQQQALLDIQGFTRDGQKMGAEGQLNTLWNDTGESLANANWYGILFGAAAAWQQGESSIPQFQQDYGVVFHGDATGYVNQAQDELNAAMQIFHDAKVISDSEGTDGLFWIDPWSRHGQQFAAAMRPIAAPVRLHAERALALLAQARAANPSLREQDALNAIDFAARRIDFLGLVYQLSDEMINDFAQAQATAASDHWKKAKPGVNWLLSELSSVNGRMQDLTYGYSQLRDMYQQQWLSSYRPANLRPVLERYDYTVQLWISRIDQLEAIHRDWRDNHIINPADAAKLGIPAPLTPVAASPADTAPKP
ncbi:MAG: family 20 glycosylhydrolase [Acidobacteriaceae bacterium]|nr:family 20 glycosylhydrolase [Acidobacteriaceae bacterium]